jgi:hypothetical protein
VLVQQPYQIQEHAVAIQYSQPLLQQVVVVVDQMMRHQQAVQVVVAQMDLLARQELQIKVMQAETHKLMQVAVVVEHQPLVVTE